MVNRLVLFVSGICCMFFMACGTSPDVPRERIDFTEGWRFRLGDTPEAADADFVDEEWRMLNLPHDWAIEGLKSPMWTRKSGLYLMVSI